MAVNGRSKWWTGGRWRRYWWPKGERNREIENSNSNKIRDFG